MKQLNFLFAFALVIGCLASASADDGTLYVASKVYTMDGDPISPGQVLVVDGKIKSVGNKIALDGLSPNVIDLGENSVLMPGLVDAYSQTALGSAGTDEITKEVTPDFRATLSIDWKKKPLRHQLLAGTTTMCVCPGTQNVIAGVAGIIKTHEHDGAILVDDGPLLGSLCNDPTARNGSRTRPDSIYIRQPTNRMGVVWVMRKSLFASKQGNRSDLSRVAQVLDKQRQFMIVSRMSHDIHTVATLADEFEFSPIIVGGQEAYKVKELLAERKYPVILQKVPTDALRGAEGSELCWNQAGVLAEAGVQVAMSGNDLLDQARFAHRYGLDADAALQAITVTPSKILNIDERVGSIAAGKDADLIALTGEPLKLTTSIRWVMVNGNIIETNKGN